MLPHGIPHIQLPMWWHQIQISFISSLCPLAASINNSVKKGSPSWCTSWTLWTSSYILKPYGSITEPLHIIFGPSWCDGGGLVHGLAHWHGQGQRLPHDIGGCVRDERGNSGPPMDCWHPQKLCSELSAHMTHQTMRRNNSTVRSQAHA